MYLVTHRSDHVKAIPISVYTDPSYQPVSYMDVIARCSVIEAYTKKDDNELNLKIGDEIDVYRKGKFIWYGRQDESRGFFPSKCVREIEEKTEETLSKPDIALSSTQRTAVEKSKPSEIFEGIQATHILPDKRRTRIKSTARPPSQVFLKDNILQKYNSFEDLDALSDDENLIKTPQKPIRKISDLSQVVFELNHRINMKTVQQKETTIKAASTENLLQATKHAQKPDAKKSEHAGQTVPWLKELQNRREHKLSLRGDETFEKITGEIFNREANFLGKKSEIKIEAIPEKRQVTRSSSNTSLLTKSTFFEKSTIEQSKMTMVAKEKVESKDVEAPLIKLQGKLTDATKKESEVTVKPESGSLSASENVAVVSNAAEGLIKNAVQGLLKNIDGFLLKSKARQDSFQEEINKLQEMLDREYQQDKAFVENLRAELKALAENKRAE